MSKSIAEDRLVRHVESLPDYRAYLAEAWWQPEDEDADAPGCTPECPCARCQQADQEEQALREYEERTA